MFDSIIDVSETTTTDKPKIFVKTGDQDKKLYFFTRIAQKIDFARIKQDFSNKDEVMSQFNSLYELESSTLTKLNDEIIFIHASDTEVEGEETVSEIPPGFYNVGQSREFGYFLIETNPSKGDQYINLGGTFETIQKTINTFYKKEKIYRDLGLLHKMGYLLYGPPGNGKTMLIRELVKKYKNDSVIIFIDEDFPKGLIKNLKSFPSNYIFVFEEMTHILQQHGGLAKLLLFLDGEYSLDKQLVLATTNYPEELPENLASRPSRFDKVIKVDNPDNETRRRYLQEMLPNEDIDEIVKLTKDMSIAYLKEIILTSKVSDEDILDVIKENKERIRTVQKNFAPNSGRIGL